MNHTNDKDAQCYFDLRMENIRAALANTDKQEELFNDVLAIDPRIALNIQLSTGGPGDGFTIICDAVTGRPLSGSHYFVDWGYRREQPLSADELDAVCAAYAVEDARLFLNRMCQ